MNINEACIDFLNFIVKLMVSSKWHVTFILQSTFSIVQLLNYQRVGRLSM